MSPAPRVLRDRPGLLDRMGFLVQWVSLVNPAKLAPVVPREFKVLEEP